MDNPLVAHGLAGDAGANAGQRIAALLRDRLAAIVAFLGALTMRRQSAGAQNGVLHRILDLLLDRPVARPSAGHVFSYPSAASANSFEIGGVSIAFKALR